MTDVVLDLDNQKPPLTASPERLDRLLTCIEDEILPLTKEGVTKGNKVFGAAILNKEEETVLAQTNDEMQCPLFHGEVHAIYKWSQKTPPGERGEGAQSGIFLATHEPCCLCISAIVWTGFTKCYYLFPYESTAAQGIPHDINIMHELWGVKTYRKASKYCASAGLMPLIEQVEDKDKKKALQKRVDTLVQAYDDLSNQYHTEKSKNTDNSLAFG